MISYSQRMRRHEGRLALECWRLRMTRQFARDLVHMRRRYGWRRYFMPSCEGAELSDVSPMIHPRRLFIGRAMAREMGRRRIADVIAESPAQHGTPHTAQDAPQPPQWQPRAQVQTYARAVPELRQR